MDPNNIIPEKNNFNFVEVGELLIIPDKAEVSITSNDIMPDFFGYTVVRGDFSVIVKVRNLGASPAVNVTVELSDFGLPIGSVTINVPPVTKDEPYDQAFAIAEFNYRFSGVGQHVLSVHLDYPGEEAIAVQTNNNATILTHAVGSSVSARGFSTSVPVFTVLALLCAIACRRKEEED
jgi:subtilase family serine protease